MITEAERKMRFLYEVRSKGVTDAATLEAIESIDRGAVILTLPARKGWRVIVAGGENDLAAVARKTKREATRSGLPKRDATAADWDQFFVRGSRVTANDVAANAEGKPNAVAIEPGSDTAETQRNFADRRVSKPRFQISKESIDRFGRRVSYIWQLITDTK